MLSATPTERKCWGIVHTEASLGWGGQEIRVLSECLALQARGHRVRLVAPPRAQIFGKAREAGLPVEPISTARPAYPWSILKLALQFRSWRPDVVNTHSSRDGWIAGIAARLAGVPVLIRSRHIDVDYPNTFLSRIAYRGLPHHVLATSSQIRDNLIASLGLDPETVTNLPTGLDLEKFPRSRSGTLKNELGLAPDTRLAGMISVLRSWKGHRYFLEAAAALKDEPHLLFVIAGDGPMRTQIEAWIAELGVQDRVRLLGHREDVANLLASLEVVVLPSYAHEGVPQILLQARAVGCPAIGTTVGGIPETIEENKTGLLVPPRDGAALAQALRLLLNDSCLQSDLQEYLATRDRHPLSLDAMCERLEALYPNLLPR
jgi:glycosyltransferase involved in cell wall biosynthesis